MAEYKLDEIYLPLSTNVDVNKKPFISTMEGYKYPFYGVQWHPERSVFEWWPTEAADHSSDTIRSVNWLAQFFVDEVLRNEECEYDG